MYGPSLPSRFTNVRTPANFAKEGTADNWRTAAPRCGAAALVENDDIKNAKNDVEKDNKMRMKKLPSADQTRLPPRIRHMYYHPIRSE